MKVWGRPTSIKQIMSNKLEAKFDRCLFVGYPNETNGYQFYNYLEQKVFVSKDVVFMEKKFLLEDSGIKVELREVQNAQTDVDHLTGYEVVIHIDEGTIDLFEAQAFYRTTRTHTIIERYGFLIGEQKNILLIEDDKPTTYEESLNSSEFDKWLIATKSKMDSIYTNQVWTLVDPPEEIKPIGFKWIFKRKMDMEGNVIFYKARLVAKGYCQRQWIDYDETLNLVAMLKSIRILLAIAAHYDYEIWQMDVKMAFLNGNLYEEVYMTQPEGFIYEN